MPGCEATLKLRPALLRPVRRRDLAIATAVLVSSATGGAVVALLQPAPRAIPQPATIALPLPVPVATAPAPGVAPAALPFDLAPVIEDGGLRVVLATEVEPQWLADAIEVSDHEGIRLVERPLAASGAARFARMQGLRLRLLGEAGRSCVAEVGRVSAVGRFAPDDLGEGESAMDVSAAWQAAAGSHVIAGELAPVTGDCAGALWAQPEAAEPPVAASVAGASADQTRRASDLLRASPDFAERTAGAPVRFEVDAVAIEGGETVLVASALVEGCADFEPVLSTLYAVQADGSLHPLGGDTTIGSIAAAADVDRDGHAEILVRGDALDSSILRRRTDGYRQEMHVAVPIYGCRC